jgi:hypothetical protein
MNGFVKALIVASLAFMPAPAANQATIETTFADQDTPLLLDPSAPFWQAARSVHMDKNPFGEVVPGYRTEVRTRWTKQNLYFLFVCPYEQLHLKPEPKTRTETNQLWNWDVAEVFIGSNFADIQRYKEFEVSPQGEWIDLDIDLHNPRHEDGWTWNSGFEVLAKIDPHKRIWYAAMRIPFPAIDERFPVPGNTLRVNLFRSQGPPEHVHAITWQPPMRRTFHVPERFGLLKLLQQNR